MQNVRVKPDQEMFRTILVYGITIGLLVSALICIFACIINRHFYVAALMPIVAMVVFTVNTTNKKSITRLSLSIINISMFIRYGVYPAVMITNGTAGLAYADDVEAILLLLYELIGVYIVIGFKGNELSIKNVRDNGAEYKSYLGIVTLLLILFMIPACVISPSLLKQFSLSSSTVKLVDESTAGFIVSFFSMGIWTLMTLILGSLGKITKNNNALIRGLGLLLAIVISSLYLLSRVVNGANVRRWGIICTGLVTATILIRTFPNKRKQIIRIATVGIFIGVIVGSVVKFRESYSIYSFFIRQGSFANLDAYFSGVKSVRNGINAIEFNPIARSFRSTLTDLFSGVPLISRFFNANIDSVPIVYLNYLRRTDLICPLVVQSLAHFGVIGAPILSMVLTWLALEFNKRLIVTDSLYKTFVYVELVFYLSLVMELNTLIVLGVVWIRLIYLIFLRFDRKVYVGKWYLR